MRKVTIARPQKIQFPFIKGKILIDGKECEVVKAGKTAEIQISDGSHDVQVTFASIPPTNSNPIYIDEADGDLELVVNIKVPLKSNDTAYAELTKK